MACRQSTVIATISSHVSEPPTAPINESLDRLVAIEPTTLPVISVYLDTRPDAHGRVSALIPYLSASMKFSLAYGSWAHRNGSASTRTKIDTETNGVAVFACCGADGFFESL